MPRSHRLSKVSQAIVQRNDGKHHQLGKGHHRCLKSPTGSHWWVIATPDGTFSNGVCRYCGEQKLFANTIGMSPYVRAER